MADSVLARDRHDPRIQVTLSCTCGMTLAINEAPNLSNGTAPDAAASLELAATLWRLHIQRHGEATAGALQARTPDRATDDTHSEGDT